MRRAYLVIYTVINVSFQEFSKLGYAKIMPAAKIVHYACDIAVARSTWGGRQNFLGARWVEHVVNKSPGPIREGVALRLLSLSPHYFYDRDVRTEAERNWRSRQALADALIVPHLPRTARVLDYGCGPGYMARAVAERADHVYAADISAGVLACARALNGRPNITYLKPNELRQQAEKVDLAYSFAVVQHLGTEALVGVLRIIADTLRPGGILLLHFAEPGGQDGWRREVELMDDRSLVGRARLYYGLNCFGRSAHEMKKLASEGGYVHIETRSLNGIGPIPGENDIVRQHLLTARRS
jgi:SAM-dependent methyltransferase